MTIVVAAASTLSLSPSPRNSAPVTASISAHKASFPPTAPVSPPSPSAAAVRVNQASFPPSASEENPFRALPSASLASSPLPLPGLLLSGQRDPPSRRTYQSHPLPSPSDLSLKAPKQEEPGQHSLVRAQHREQHHQYQHPHQRQSTSMQSVANTLDNDHSNNVGSPLDIKPGKAHAEIQPTTSIKRSPSDTEFHQRSYSAAMGPMGANENHGPIRGLPAQEGSSQKLDNTRNDRSDYANDRHQDAHQGKGHHRHGREGEHDQYGNGDMEDEGEGSNLESEENIDELMDEGEFEDGDEPESTDNRAYYSHSDTSRSRGEQSGYRDPSDAQQQGNRSFTSIMPRPGSGTGQSEPGSGYGHGAIKRERDEGDDQRHGGPSSWDARGSREMPRQGAPRNNRPLQVRPVAGSEMLSGGYSNGDDDNNGENDDDGELNDDTGSASGNAIGVNNGSSKKRTTPAKHKCPQCDKYFTRPFNLKSHQRTHTQERPFVCSFAHCARAFSRLHDCNRHMRTHWRIKPYSCPECHRNFVRQDALTRHLRLDFGHNRCSGFPGPLPGSSNQDKTDESGDDAMGDSPTDSQGHSYPGSARNEGGNATLKAGPYTPTSPTSPTHSSTVAHQGRAGPRPEHDVDRLPAPLMAMRDPRIAPKPISASEPTGSEHMDENVSHGRHQNANAAPISFVHRSAATPPELKESPSYPAQHSRSFSHSSFSHGQPSAPAMAAPPLTSQASGPPSTAPPGAERRSTANMRNGAPWPAQGHDSATSPTDYYQGPPASSRPPPPAHIVTRQDPPFAADYDRQRSAGNPLSEYPPSPQDARRPSPPHSAEWSAHGQEGSRPWGWEHRSQDSRPRHPTWSDSPSSRAPVPISHPQEQAPHPSSMPPPLRAHTMDSWQRGAPSSLREPQEDLSPREPRDPRDSRDGPLSARPPPRAHSSYTSSPYPTDPAADHRPMAGHSQAMTRTGEPYRRPELDRDPRQRSMTEIERVRGPGATWSEQRSRSFHEIEGGMNPRSRFEPHPSSPQHPRENPLLTRSPAGEPLSSGSERPHAYSGMVGVERAYPQGSQYQDREGPRDGGLGQKQPMMKEPLSRDYRQVRSYSNMDYETEWDSFHRQSRYSGDQKMPPRENRRSMSPISAHRHSGMESGRPFEGNTARYPYPSERQDQYSREEMDRLPPRPFRHDDKMVASPLPREDQPGYFEQAGRSNSYRAPTTNYGIPQHRGQEPLPRHADGSHESARRERHSIDMPLASPTTPVGAPPPKRSMSTATIATR